MEKMIAARISSTTVRKDTVVSTAKPLREIFDEANVPLEGDVSVNISGKNIRSEHFDKSIDELGIDTNVDKLFLTSTVNTKNA